MELKIAFASCATASYFPHQPVWTQITAQSPDVLVLLGDSVYFDVPVNPVHPQTIGLQGTAYPPVISFAALALARYHEQLAVPEFKAIVNNAAIQKFAIWDDHDFLWNGAQGDVLRKDPVQHPKMLESTALFTAYRNVLAASNTALMPNAPIAAAKSLLGYSYHVLSSKVVLHLTDGRSFRRKNKQLLGAEQCRQMADVFQSYSAALHIVTSGTTLTEGSESWKETCSSELDWLIQQAKSYRIIVISGDIHKNALHTHTSGTSGGKLHEVTSSGAAVNSFMAFGADRSNFGMLHLSGTRNIGVGLYGMTNSPALTATGPSEPQER